MKITNLYAYFGFLGIYQIDSPGHTFYQLGLIDSLKEEFGGDNFDFYSYYPEKIKNEHHEEFFIPNDEIGHVFSNYFQKLMNVYNISLENTLEKIRVKQYGKIFLKARFRNLSTLSKKWDDTLQFEKILEEACKTYSREDIIILDTDLSLPETFIAKYASKVTILTPSLDFPGISSSFLDDCVKVNLHKFETNKKKKGIIYYGNIDTSNYKSSNSKSSILIDALRDLAKTQYADSFCPINIVGKKDTPLDSIIGATDLKLIDRSDRESIWKALNENLVMLNISKDKYAEVGFIPARIYEAMIFGMIPVSYRFSFLNKAFSFKNIDELSEIIKYLDETSSQDWAIAYSSFINSYKKHEISLNEKRKNNTSMP